MQAELENVFAALALGPEPDARDAASARAWLDARGVSAEDRDAILEQGFERLLVYRRLVRENLREALRLAIPRTMARMGPLFDEYFDRFLAERGPRTHYLRDVTAELLAFAEPLWRADSRVPRYLSDLARHEAVQIEIGAMQSKRRGEPGAELTLERPVRFVEAVRVMRYDHAVHRLSDDEADRAEPAAEPVALLVYRSPEHEVRYLELTPLAAAILERLLAGQPLGEAIRRAVAGAGAALDSSVLAGTSELLADLAERGALLGGAAS